eukprot:195244_1
MAVLYALLIVSIKASIHDIRNLNQAKFEGNYHSRSLLQTSISANDVNGAETMACDDTKTGQYGFGPIYYEFILTEQATVNFANCETQFDPNLYVYNSNYEWISDTACDGNDCGNCNTAAREEFDLTLDPGSYYIQLYPCCDPTLEVDGDTYYITTTCLIAGSPTRAPTEAPTRAPTVTSGDLSTCNSAPVIVQVPDNFDSEVSLWFSMNSVDIAVDTNEIDICDNDEGYNDFSFELSLYTNPGDIPVIIEEPRDCPEVMYPNIGYGKLLTVEREIYGTNDIIYADFWLKVTVHQTSSTNKQLKLTRYCQIAPTRDLTVSPSRSPLFSGETRAPTTKIPTRNPVTRVPTESPNTSEPSVAPIFEQDVGNIGSASCYWVVCSIFGMVIAALFVQ